MPTIQHNPERVFPPYRNYSHAVEVKGMASMLFISGLKAACFLAFIVMSFSASGQRASSDERNGNCKEREKPDAAARLRNYPFNRAAQIRLVSFDYLPHPPAVEHQLPEKDGHVDTSRLTEQKNLSKQGVDSLAYILYNIGYSGKISVEEISMCYDPRNAILFLDDSGQVFEFIEICFQCDVNRVSSENIKTGEFCIQKYALLKEFFTRNGIEIGTVKEIEH